MIIDAATELKVKKYMPGTWAVYEKYDRLAQQMGATLTVRDTDHWQDSLRCYIEGDKENRLSNELREELHTTCHICGSRHDGVCRCIPNPEEWTTYCCPDCYATYLYESFDYKGLLALKSEYPLSPNSVCLSLKIKILLPNGDLHYVRLQDMTFSNGEYFLIENGKDLMEAQMDHPVVPKLTKVRIMGVYTGHRDVTHERIYTDDMVICLCDNGRFFDSWARVEKMGNGEPRPAGIAWSEFAFVLKVSSLGDGRSIVRKIDESMLQCMDEHHRKRLIEVCQRYEGVIHQQIFLK